MLRRSNQNDTTCDILSYFAYNLVTILFFTLLSVFFWFGRYLCRIFCFLASLIQLDSYFSPKPTQNHLNLFSFHLVCYFNFCFFWCKICFNGKHFPIWIEFAKEKYSSLFCCCTRILLTKLNRTFNQ